VETEIMMVILREQPEVSASTSRAARAF
jgi:hypothetical protein